MANPFDNFSIWAIYIIQVAVFIFPAELGFRLGNYRYQNAKDPSKIPLSQGVGALMTLLAFILAITFGMGSSRFDTRKNLVLEETNAIGTAYLRADLLPDPQRQKCKAILRDYVRDRSVSNVDYSYALQLNERSEQLHKQLWDQVVSLKSNDEYSVAYISFVEVLNKVIDLHTSRFNSSLRNRIPISIWLTLYTITVLSLLLKGYSNGLSGKNRSFFAGLILILSFSAVLLLIQDLDRPLSDSHLIEIGKQVMVDLLEKMNAP